MVPGYTAIQLSTSFKSGSILWLKIGIQQYLCSSLHCRKTNTPNTLHPTEYNQHFWKAYPWCTLAQFLGSPDSYIHTPMWQETGHKRESQIYIVTDLHLLQRRHTIYLCHALRTLSSVARLYAWTTAREAQSQKCASQLCAEAWSPAC